MSKCLETTGPMMLISLGAKSLELNAMDQKLKNCANKQKILSYFFVTDPFYACVMS